MMITIHGLPPPTKYADLKVLIKQKCNITDFILDSLMSDGADGTKKVRVGLADDSEGSHLMKCLDGYRLSGYALRVVPVAKSSQANHSQQNTYNDNYQQSNDYHQPNQMPERSRQAEAPRPAAWVNQPGNQWQANQSTQPSAQNTYNYQQQQQPTYGHNQVNQPIKPQFEQREVMQPSHRAQPNQAYSHSYSQKSNLISLGPQRNAPSNVARDVPEAASRPMQGGRFAAQQNYDMPDKPPQRNAPSNVARDVPEAASRPMQGGRFAAQQNYDMPDKPPLRSLPSAGREGPEAGARPTPGGRFPAQQNYNMPDKPLTIMKDNFQGPTQYNLAGREPAPELAPYAPTAQAPWASQHQPKPFEKPIPTYEKKPYDDRKYPPIAQIKDDLPKPDPFKGYDRPREFSPRRQERGYPPRRDISPERAPPSGIQVPHSGRISPGRRVSPSRRISPGRRISPERQVYMDRRSPGRRISPHGRQGFPDNRRASPGRVIVSDRRISPSGRHIQVTEMAPSPPHRRISPPRKEVYVRGRISPPTHTPADRRMRHPSPGAERDDARRLPHARRESPRRQAMRYSPTRHHGDKPMPMDYQDNRPNVKNVRPAYEPPTQASNEAKYSGGFRPNVREDVHYPVRGQERWPEKEFAHKDPEDRRDTIRLQKFDIPRDSEQEPMRSGNRLSRSPRRDRSPLNRVRRHSPSPRSPRRSWALEKRRSPEIREPPPPPIWPGQDNKNPNYQHPGRPNFPERDHEKTSPVWQSSSNKKIINDEFIRQRNADREHFEEEMRRRQADVKWKPVPQMSPKGTSSRYIDDDRALRDDKFARKGFEERRDYREDHELSGRRDRDDSRYKPDFEMKDDIPSKKQVYPARIEERKKEILKKQEQLQKEIDEVYKRAVDFTKKAELYRKGELKKDSSFEPRRRDEDSSDSEASYEGYSRKDRKDYEGSRHESSERITKSTPQKSKRDTAIEQIADKLMSSHGSHLPNDLKSRVVAKLQLSVSNILKKMFGNQDVSFIEMVIKFNSHHTVEDEERIFDAVMSDFPAQFRRPKKPAKDDSDVPAKSSRRSDDPNLNAGGQPRASEQISDWNVMPSLVNTPIGMAQVSHQGIMMNAPVMVPMPAQYHFVPAQGYNESLEQAVTEETKKDGHSLYLCKDDFQTIEDFETVELKDFLVKQLIKETQMSHGWAPDFTLAKQNSSYRHEVITRDERSRDWLLNLDFSEFQLFNVLVYTTEELWYERAAIWLPGHSRYRNIDPLTKLKLQNKRLEGINIGKWKFVKKIVNEKGTRVYVDMPPSAARALEKHNMLLTYELQKVNVFLKAVAIDKEAFDAGLNERSIDYLPSPNLTPMPSIPGNDNDIIQIAFKGNKPLTLPIARKVKDTIIYKMYKYHQLDGKSKTDFVKYGFCQPGYFCILPENSESRKWLRDLDLGKINRTPLIILGEDDIKNKYFNMSLVLPFEMKPKLACERIKQSNRGVKGINFSLWKNHKVERNRQNYILNVDMDLESIETIAKMKYKLDLVIENREYTVDAESNLPRAKLEETIAKYKAELSDKYDVANMDLASDTDDDIICLD